MELRVRKYRPAPEPRLVNHCAQCGAMILLPEWSEYLDHARVRHLWTCQACDYRFETTVRMAEA